MFQHIIVGWLTDFKLGGRVMRHLTKTNKHFLLVGLTFLATSLIFYILAWLGRPSLENTLVTVSSIAFTLGVVTYILLGLKMITDTLKTSSHP